MHGEMEMEKMHPLITEAIRDGGQFVLIPKGVSMLPTIEPLKDSLVLVTPENLQKNDIVLYKRKNGTYVAHRIVSIKNGYYTMCGDNQITLEKGIEQQQIIALISEIRKSNGKIVSSQDIRNKRALFSLHCRRLPKKAKQGVKKLLYPIYKALFKRNKK